MNATALELLDLVFRWVHVIAGIMWIGNSLLFNWLDRILLPSSRPGDRTGMQGETWLIHSGGFYFVEKTLLAGQQVPRPLHWFKWQAYTTWMTGAVLLIIVYYAGGRALLVDPAVAQLGSGQAVMLGIAAVLGGLALYELIWRVVAPRSAAIAGAVSIAALAALSFALTQTLSGRAAYLHVGAMLGTIMAGNVLLSIIPSQRALVTSVRTGGMADPEIGNRAKTRSIHNNYLTFPVIVLMLSSHFPSLYGHRWSWVLLLLLTAVGAAVRHLMNMRFTYRRWIPVLATVVVAGGVSLYYLVTHTGAAGAQRTAQDADVPHTVEFAEVRSIIDRRCTTCHSRQPSDDSFGPAPGGAAFDTREQIEALRIRIHERAVVTQTMPPANKTRMPERERALLGVWTEANQGERPR